jgi:hypothetical protein
LDQALSHGFVPVDLLHSAFIAIGTLLQLLRQLMEAFHRCDDNLIQGRDCWLIQQCLEETGRTLDRARIVIIQWQQFGLLE